MGNKRKGRRQVKSVFERTAVAAAGYQAEPGKMHSCLQGLVILLLSISLLACASREVLVPKNAAVPAGVDLSGTWRLRDDGGDRTSINKAIRATDGVRDTPVAPPLEPPSSRRRPVPQLRRNVGGLVHVFLQHGKTLKITQTDAGLFLSFDRAVVQEFRFGENREVRVGPVLADRVSGWEGEEYVAVTLDQEGMKLTERFSLINRHTLRRTITFRSKNNETVTVVQTFDRIG